MLKTVYNVYFRHRGIPTKFWFAASDWTYWKASRFDVPFRVIAKLHRELGTSSTPRNWLTGLLQAPSSECNRITSCSMMSLLLRISMASTRKRIKVNFISMLLHQPDTHLQLPQKCLFPPRPALTCRNKSRHGFLRRVMNSSFGPTSLKNLEPTMNRYYNEFLEGIAQRASQNDGIVEINEWFHNLSFDVRLSSYRFFSWHDQISGALALGTDFNSLKSGEPHFFIKALHGTFSVLSLVCAHVSYMGWFSLCRCHG